VLALVLSLWLNANSDLCVNESKGLLTRLISEADFALG